MPPTARSPSATNSLYLPPLEDPQRPNSMLQPAPSFLSTGNRDSSYSSSLNDNANRQSWGSTAMVRSAWFLVGPTPPLTLAPARGQLNTPPSRSQSQMGMLAGSSPLAQRDDETDSPDPAFAGSPGTGDTPLQREQQRLPSRLGGAALPSAAAIHELGWNADPHGDDEAEKPKWMQRRDGGGGKRRLWLWILVGLIVAAVVALAVGLGVHFGVKNGGSGSSSENAAADPSSTSDGSSPTRTGSAAAPTATVATSGFSGSTLLLLNGTSTTYTNPHGGMWAYDASNPFLFSAQPNSWTPPLNESWDMTQKIYGVAVGGWFVTEPFIAPNLYERYATGAAGSSVDEYTLSINMGADLASAMEAHYDTFITEQDFIDMVAAGLNWIRIPIPHWAIETFPGEPFLEGVAWKYIVRALTWARKYGLRVNLDLHTVPGSQNGWNHSGKLGDPNWMYGAMGLANMQRSLNYIRTILEFISQPEWAPVVPMFGIVNEPLAGSIGQAQLAAFYIHAHDMIRNITGYGAGKGPYISIHEGFLGVSQWYGYFQNANSGMDRVQMDVHNYLVFQDQDPSPASQLANVPCNAWAAQSNQTLNEWGTYNTGEWSVAINDCGHWVNGVGQGQRYDGTFNGYSGKAIGSCDQWNDPTAWSNATIQDFRNRFYASSDALQSNFFWTWKIADSTQFDYPVNPQWSYSLGLKYGYVPSDPRAVEGYCVNSAGIQPTQTFTGFKPFMTGGAGAGTVPASDIAAYTWPLTSMRPSFGVDALASLPQYTATASPITLSNPTYTLASTVTQTPASGWAYSTDTKSDYAPVSGCSYPGEYAGASMGVSAGACGAGAGLQAAGLRRAPMPAITPAPARK